MADIETLKILEEMEVLVSDKLQVVSYKWLSRNFSVSSDVAKKLLKEFVEKNGSGLEVVYSMSGWLKKNSSDYHIRLIPGTKLTDAKLEFDGNCSVHVYSVQACLPKDPATLWNTEFVQAEELYMQPSAVDNCLRDNRFCGIFNSFIKRNTEGLTSSITSKPQSLTIPVSCKSNSSHHTKSVTPQLQQGKVQQPSPKAVLQSPNIATDVKSETNGTKVHETKPPAANKEKALNKKNGQSDKNSTGARSSLANMWGRASTKPKPNSPPAETNNLITGSYVSAEAQICVREVTEGRTSDDEDQDVNFKRVSNNEGNRKRRAVFYFSDEEDNVEDVVSLGSPELPKGQSCPDLKQSIQTLDPKKIDLDTDIQSEDKLGIRETKTTEDLSNEPFVENIAVLKGKKNTGASSPKDVQIPIRSNDVDKKGKVVTTTPNSPKRRKVLKTRIDERGREVTEVVWEGEEIDAKIAEKNTIKKAETNMTKKADTNDASIAVNRAPVTKKSPAVGATAPSKAGGKAGNKKGGTSKDPKQGNILSFFKRA